MVGARHLRGTVLSRVSNLLRSGALDNVRKPLWMAVVEAFPPLTETKVNRKATSGRMRRITYPEDEFRLKFYRTFQINETLCLWKDEPSICDRFVDKCVQLVEEGKDSETAFQEAASVFNLNNRSQDSRKDATNDVQSILVAQSKTKTDYKEFELEEADEEEFGLDKEDEGNKLIVEKLMKLLNSKKMVKKTWH